jgi:hypothetical protein
MKSVFTIVAMSILVGSPLLAQSHHRPTDAQIEAQVQQTISSDNAFHGSTIMSSVNKGIVKLTGNVRSEAEKELVSQDLANIDGVKTVLNNLGIADNSFHAPAPAPLPAGPTGPKAVTLAAGTAIAVRLSNEIDSKTAKAGDTFHGTTAAALTLGSYTVVPAGSAVTGRITEAKAAGRLNGSAEVSLELMSVRVAGSTGPEDASLLTQTLTGKTTQAGGSSNGIDIGTNLFTHVKQIDLKPYQLLQFRTSAPFTVTIQLKNGKQVPAAPPAAAADDTQH